MVIKYNSAEFERSYGLFEQLPAPSGVPEFAFSGRSNVGKSSLINKIVNRKSLARTSSTPGKTVTINFFSIPVVLDGGKKEKLYFTDLPGYGYAKVSKSEKERWRGLVEGYLNDTRRGLSLVFQLVDFRHPPTKDDIMMIDFLADNEIPFAVVLTKADKLKKREREERIAALSEEIPYEDVTLIPFSAVTGEGTEEIQRIAEEIYTEYIRNGKEPEL